VDIDSVFEIFDKITILDDSWYTAEEEVTQQTRKSRLSPSEVKEKIVTEKKKQLSTLRKMVSDFSHLRLLLVHPFFDELKDKKSNFKTPKKIARKFQDMDNKENLPIPPRLLNISNDRVGLVTSAEIARGTPTKLPKRTTTSLVPPQITNSDRSGLVSSAEISKGTPTKLLLRTNTLAPQKTTTMMLDRSSLVSSTAIAKDTTTKVSLNSFLMISSKPLSGILKPFTLRRRNRKERRQFLSKLLENLPQKGYLVITRI